MSGPRVAVLGSGANGTSIGVDLARAGVDVTLVEQWPDHVASLRADGARVQIGDEVRVAHPPVYHLCQVAEMREPFDVVLMAMKAYDARWAAELVKPVLSPDGLLVGVQNGMTADVIAEVVGPDRTVGCVIECSAAMPEPGVVRRYTPPASSWFAVGSLSAATTGRESEVADLLRHSGTVATFEDIRSAKWMKLVSNCSVLVPSAILDAPLAEAVRIPGVHEFMVECGKEAARAAIADGSTLVPIFGLTHDQVTGPDQYAEDLLGEVLERFSRPDTLTTVLQDWMKGRRAEVDDVNGLVVQVLEAVGEKAPYNAHTVDLAHRIERGELARSRDNLDLLLGL